MFCSANVNPSAVVPDVTWKLKSVVKFWTLTAVGNHALPAWVVVLGVTFRLVPLIAEAPLSTSEPAVKPLPKVMPPPPLLLMTYAAEPTPLSKKPLLVAIAFKVSLEPTVTGAVYCAELLVGVEPLVV